MTEPVAYRVDGTIYNDINEAESAVREIEHLRNTLGMDNGLIRRPKYIEPLYTAEDLHPRVKMTQAEFDEFKKLHKSRNHLIPIHFLKFLLDNGDSYPLLHSRYWNGREDQLALLTLWLRFDPDKPEETIEIVPNMKWFVVRKLPNAGGNMLKCSDEGLLMYNAIKEAATHFDTKEEAELWTNPLTEAVQLPVEGE
ncbi:hypothetical protein J3326_02085 [Leuconostoc mesenteroides]|uniref:hypothetical protein n=1 Tax=Leuconostoc mesenteroides TaxID=1245 RepID=UPI001CBC185E|nr:hypothetical protein [Leuconostoc mesenteroides]MBZ1515976.1 hypothetical protein [Leuconostoc mesenteroides]